MYNLFDILAYGAGLWGSFDPAHYNLQKFVVMVAHLLGYTVSIGVG